MTGMDGIFSNGLTVSRRWLLGAAVASTAQTSIVTAAGILVRGMAAPAAKPGQIGFNTVADNAQGTASFLFLNRMKSAAYNGVWNNDAPLSPHLYPTGIAAGRTETATYVSLRRPAIGTIRYVLRHNGTALRWRWALASAIRIVDRRDPNRVVFDVGPAPAGEGAPTLVLSGATVWPDYRPDDPQASRDGIAIYELDREAEYLAGKQFYAEAVAAMSANYSTRFMDVQKTNNSTATSATDRTLVGSCSYSQGTRWGPPLEALIDICNEARSHFWFCVPLKASSALVQWIGETVRDRLDPSLYAFPEAGNEVWNGGGGFQDSYAYAAQYGQAINPAWGNQEGFGVLAAKMMIQLFQIFVGQEQRLQPVLSRQGGVRSTMDGAKTGIESTGHRVRELFTAVATGFYFGGPIQILNELYRKTADPNITAADQAAATQARQLLLTQVEYFEAHGVVSADLIGQLRHGNVIPGWPSFNTFSDVSYGVGSDFARDEGLKHHFGYEGQNFHATLDSFDQDQLGTRANVMLEAAHNDPRVAGTAPGSFCRDQYAMQRGQYGMTNFEVLTDVGPNTKFGSWRTKQDFFSADTPLWSFYKWYGANGPDPILFEINMRGGDVNFRVGLAVNRTIASFGGLAVAGDVTIVSGTLPAGLTFTKGVLSGTPTATGTSNVTFRAIDGGGNVVQKAFAFAVAAAPVAGPKFDHVAIRILRTADQTTATAAYPAIAELRLIGTNNVIVPAIAWTGDQQDKTPLTNINDGDPSTNWQGNYGGPIVIVAQIASASVIGVGITSEGIRAPGDFEVRGFKGVPPADGIGGTLIVKIAGMRPAEWQRNRDNAISEHLFFRPS